MVLRAPVSALFRSGQGWAVFALGGDRRARIRRVGIGEMNDRFAEVTSGLAAGDRVILHPSDRVGDGVRVRERR